MRISLLLQREPLSDILERTLTKFWTANLGKGVSVRWMGGQRPAVRPTGIGQTWLVNAYLNAVFVQDADRAIFDPIRREFSRSPLWWRRPAQRFYVAAALSPWGARWLAQAEIRVNPPIPEARQTLIVAGNHKIRLIDWNNRQSWGLLKDGFRPVFMQRELTTRRLAAGLGLSIPRLDKVAEDGSWFIEEVVSGTPINRLTSPEHVARAETEALAQLRILHEATSDTIPVDHYTKILQQQIRELTAANHLLTEADRRVIGTAVDALSHQATADAGQVNMALTHGDFQPANILLGDDRIWLVDWEYAARRQAGYDLLVYGLRARSPHGLAPRARHFIAHGWPEATGPVRQDWLRRRWSTIGLRRTCVVLFLLEELVLHLEENAQPMFTRLGDGLQILLSELTIWAGAGMQA